MAKALDGNIGWLLSSAARLAQRRQSTRLAEHGITPPQWCVLASLWEQDGLSLSALAQQTAFDGPTMTGIIDRLESAGYVQRQRDTQDRRVITVSLREDGLALQQVLPPLIAQAERETLAGLTENQIRDLFTTLREVITNLTSSEQRAGNTPER